ncbi:hypothetical protein BIV25_44140 [Streptomyces sp. MUSC 14]|uniref:hypothetical protein n=1 Tax=Streptomyces sp. MUSC 14 TaxID=1354889 RepID=UPI0008F562AD|nr:hypothetical protein [Streptomyces sp. MUSC 14]OIJ85365.1 hypothetical protein BIV25_44140 [Streptomyces sp. MUSC 14]
MSTAKRLHIPLLLSVAVPPWLLAALFTLGVDLLANGSQTAKRNLGLLFLTPQALVPLLVLIGSFGVIAEFRRRDRLRADQWPGAGLTFALLALVLSVAVSAAWGGSGSAVLWIWSIFSGYILFVFIFGGYAWRRTFR